MTNLRVKDEAIRTFIHTPEGQITVAVVRLLDDRLAIYEAEEDGGWLPLVGPWTARPWSEIPDPSPYRKPDRTQPSSLYEWSRALPDFYSDLVYLVNNHPLRHRTLRR